MVSIIVPTKNRLDSLKRCVSLIREHTDLPYELIIVDGGSTEPGIKEYLADAPDPNTVVIHTNAKSYSEAMNSGLQYATGDYLTIPGIANDIEVTPGWLSSCVKALEEDPEIGMAIPGVQEALVGATAWGGFIKPKETYNGMSSAEPHYAGYGIVPRRVFEEVGLMDENYSPIYLEDADYCLRVKQAGFKLCPVKDSLIIHRHSKDDRASRNDKNQIYFNKKWEKWLAQ